jgi:hypothetical protein
MTDVTTNALAILGSRDFFGSLRGALASMGLVGEEKYGVGLYLVALSRFLPSPLRLCIQENAEGNSRFLVEKVAELLPKNHRVGIYRDLNEAWPSFEKSPNNKVLWVPPDSEGPPACGSFKIDISRNRIVGVWSNKKNGRVVEKRHTAQGRFVCVAGTAPPFGWNLTRWLTIRLPVSQQSQNRGSTLTGQDLAVWHEVQRLIEGRCEVEIVLPQWLEIVIEQMFHDRRAQRHLPAFLTMWKVMAIVRSFADGKPPQRFMRADFLSFAATGAALKGTFREGYWFPSAANIYEQIAQLGAKTSLLSPITGKALRFKRVGITNPANFTSPLLLR